MLGDILGQANWIWEEAGFWMLNPGSLGRGKKGHRPAVRSCSACSYDRTQFSIAHLYRKFGGMVASGYREGKPGAEGER